MNEKSIAGYFSHMLIEFVDRLFLVFRIKWEQVQPGR